MATPELDRTNRRDQLGRLLRRGGRLRRRGRRRLAGRVAGLSAGRAGHRLGLEQAVPSDREAVKLLTVHRAKGLEWEVVFLPALMKGVFPSDRVTDNWLTNPGVLPADLRGDAQLDPPAEGDQQRGRPVLQGGAEGPAAEGRGPAGLRRGHPRPAGADRHRPHLAGRPGPATGPLQPTWTRSWPRPSARARCGPRRRRRPRPTRWSRPARRCRGPRRTTRRPGGTAARPRRRSRRRGVVKPRPAATSRRPVRAPSCCWTVWRRPRAGTPTWSGCWPSWRRPAPSAPWCTSRTRSRRRRCCDCNAIRRGWRPRSPGRCRHRRRGRRGSAPGSTSGWSATSGPRWRPGSSVSSSCWIPTTCPTPPTSRPPTRRDCASSAPPSSPARTAAGCRTPSRHPSRCWSTAPWSAVGSTPSTTCGRAVADGVAGPYDFQVVDWKTGRADGTDPLQLAIYRQAWAEVCRIPPERVDAVFYLVASDSVVRPEGLPGRAEIAALIAGTEPDEPTVDLV